MQFLCCNGQQSSLFVIQPLLLPSNCGVSISETPGKCGNSRICDYTPPRKSLIFLRMIAVFQNLFQNYRIKATFYRSWLNFELSYVNFQIFTKHHHLKGIFWNLSNMICCNIWCKIEHVGCFIHWHDFGKMWFRHLRASL